jgi:signal transduction histidine kinase
LLTSSRAEDGRLASYPTVVELGEIIAQTADAAKFNAQKKGLEIKFIVSSNNEIRGGKVVRPLFFAFVDPNRLREVIQNLIDNGIKYTQQGSITLALTGDQSVIQIQVRDTGAGVPEEDIPHLFQKFYRVDSSLTRTVGGTGLGLYLSRKIVEMYQGRIWIESQLGKGSTVFINLPRLTAERALELQQSQANTVQPQQQTINY